MAYLEGWQIIAEANRIFGFDGWQRQTIAVRCVSQAERAIGRDQKPGWGVTYTARVRVTVTAGGRPPLIREGSGAGHGIDVDLGQAHESAIKEAGDDRGSDQPEVPPRLDRGVSGVAPRGALS